FSRSLGKQELLRMSNNTYKRTYSSPPVEPTKPDDSDKEYQGKTFDTLVTYQATQPASAER
ncbi:MAG: hypothetical protein ACEQSN_06250, partial [Yersinia sp. (in: enterobacteria)]